MANAPKKIPVEMTEAERKKYAEYLEYMEKRSGRMSLRIPGDLFKKLNAISDNTGKSRSEIVVDALRRDLAKSIAAD